MTDLAPAAPAPPALAASGGALATVESLVERLHGAGIRYCHWKSNEHLDASLEGLTDLDILVDRLQAPILRVILAEVGFRRFSAVPWRAYPGVEDYLALDRMTGRLVHLHLHYELTLGERYLKGYRLPWERELLASRQLDIQRGLYTAAPELELLLLVVRATLKLRWRDRLRPGPSANYLKELSWLQARTEPGRVHELSLALLGPAAPDLVARVLLQRESHGPLCALGREIAPILRRHRTYGRSEALLRRWWRELHWCFSGLNRSYLHFALPTRRVSPTGGVILAVLGPDGAGKSSLLSAIRPWLGRKVDVLPIYFGSGDGRSSLLRLPLKLTVSLVRKFAGTRVLGRRASDGTAAASGGRGQRLRALLTIPWALVLGHEKRTKLHKARRARNRGVIVVCDRFPQNQVVAFSDGPLLAAWLDHPMALPRWLARVEALAYAEANASPPDIVVKLLISAETAARRKPGMNLDDLRRRVAAIKSLRFSPGTRVIEIDAEAPFQDVLLQLKHELWEAL